MHAFMQTSPQSVTVSRRPHTEETTLLLEHYYYYHHPHPKAQRVQCVTRDVQIDQSPIERFALLYQLLFFKKLLERELGLAQNQLRMDARG